MHKLLPDTYLTEFFYGRHRYAGPRITAVNDRDAMIKKAVLEQLLEYPELTIIGKLRAEFTTKDL